MTDAVRPTRRCLADLGIDLPDLGVRLSAIEHPLVVKAQGVPAVVVAGGGDRVRSLTDRVWFKAKVGALRGVVGDLRNEPPGEVNELGVYWWLGAAGVRQDDSARHDFYPRLAAEARRAGKNSCSTDFLLPTGWDVKRLIAEASVHAQLVVEQLVRTAARESLESSDIRQFHLLGRDIRVRIKVQADGQAYVVISSVGAMDSELFLTLVSAIPGVPADDWLPEPGGHLDFELEPGEIVWSAMISAEAQSQLLNDS